MPTTCGMYHGISSETMPEQLRPAGSAAMIPAEVRHRQPPPEPQNENKRAGEQLYHYPTALYFRHSPTLPFFAPTQTEQPTGAAHALRPAFCDFCGSNFCDYQILRHYSQVFRRFYIELHQNRISWNLPFHAFCAPTCFPNFAYFLLRYTQQ
jgi:hypothetical protein